MQKPVQFGDDIIIDADKVGAIVRGTKPGTTFVHAIGHAPVRVPAAMENVAGALGMEMLPPPNGEGHTLDPNPIQEPVTELELAILALEPFEDLAPCAAALDHLRGMDEAGTLDERSVATAQEVLAENGESADEILAATAGLVAQGLIDDAGEATDGTAPPRDIHEEATVLAANIMRSHAVDDAPRGALALVTLAKTGSRRETVTSLAHAIVTGAAEPLAGVTDDAPDSDDAPGTDDPHDILAVSREGAQEAADNAFNEAVVARKRATAADELATEAEEHAADMERNAKGVAAVTNQVRNNVAADADAEAKRIVDEAAQAEVEAE